MIYHFIYTHTHTNTRTHALACSHMNVLHTAPPSLTQLDPCLLIIFSRERERETVIETKTVSNLLIKLSLLFLFFECCCCCCCIFLYTSLSISIPRPYTRVKIFYGFENTHIHTPRHTTLLFETKKSKNFPTFFLYVVVLFCNSLEK